MLINPNNFAFEFNLDFFWKYLLAFAESLKRMSVK